MLGVVCVNDSVLAINLTSEYRFGFLIRINPALFNFENNTKYKCKE